MKSSCRRIPSWPRPARRLQVGAVPVFVDIDPDTYNLNPALIEDHITEKTRAIFAVHFRRNGRRHGRDQLHRAQA